MLRGSQNAVGLLLRGIDGAKAHHLTAFQQRLDGRDDFGEASGAQDTIHFGHLLQNLLLIALGQTACDQNLAHMTFCLQAGSGQNVVDCLCLRRVDESTGVNNHHVTAHYIGADRVACLLHAVHHPLTVHLVLGAAQRYKSDICHIYSSRKSS